MSNSPGTLYIVATPIGNLDDWNSRAVSVIGAVDVVATEDTRHSRTLFNHYGIHPKTVAHHRFNERGSEKRLLELLQAGSDVALVSDAGTPLISDPGQGLVSRCHELGIRVVPVPGASAVITALSVSGLPVDRFAFEGYLPEKQAARRRLLVSLARESRTLIFYEAPHRIVAAMADLVDVFGAERPAAVARELTKRFETIRKATLGELAAWINGDSDQQKGEFVILTGGAERTGTVDSIDPERLLRLLMEELPPARAAAVASAITGLPRNRLYATGLALRQGQSDD